MRDWRVRIETDAFWTHSRTSASVLRGISGEELRVFVELDRQQVRSRRGGQQRRTLLRGHPALFGRHESCLLELVSPFSAASAP